MYYEYDILTEKLIGRKKADFKDRYENIYYEVLDKDGRKERSEFIKRWMKDPNIKTYNTLDFYPCKTTDPHIYNTFKGFAGTKAPDNKNDFRNSYTYEHFKKTFVVMMSKKKSI